MQDPDRELQEALDIRETAYDALRQMGRRVQSFRDMLASYLIPEDGIEIYISDFIRRRNGMRDSYISRRAQESGGYIENMGEIIIELSELDSSVPGELNLEKLTPLQREYLRDMIQAQIELFQAAKDEYLK